MKNPFYKFCCNKCSFGTYSVIKFIKHCKKVHNVFLTKRDWKFIFKYHIITQILMIIFRLPLILLALLVWLICYPFWAIKEFIENIF